MPKRKYMDIKVGDKYNHWTVIGEPIVVNGHKKWLCQCDCEEKTIKYVFQYQLPSGRSKDCGCGEKRNKESYINNLSQSFYDWCIENNRNDLLDRWDYDLNERNIKTIGLNSKGKFWFKCLNNDEHKSEQHSLAILISNPKSLIKCIQCNSFGQWCIDNNRQDMLDRWDYEMNNISPFEVSKSPRKKYYLKCPKGIHRSEPKNIQSLTVGNVSGFGCNQCNSFAQWGIDNVCKDFLEKYWDYEKNTKDPWCIARAYNGKVWIKCQEKEYHGSYETSCAKFSIENRRCPRCSKTSGDIHIFDSLGYLYPESISVWSDKNDKTPYEYTPRSGIKVWWKCNDDVHNDYKRVISQSVDRDFVCPNCISEKNCSYLQHKVSKYIHEKHPDYTLLHEHYCTIIARNPNTGFILPFDNEIKELRLLCEVNGIQHYDKNNSFHKMIAKKKEVTVYEAFCERKNIDEYKKQYALSQGYEYLEIPYTAEKDDVYKILIDNKINEILNNENS